MRVIANAREMCKRMPEAHMSGIASADRVFTAKYLHIGCFHISIHDVQHDGPVDDDLFLGHTVRAVESVAI